MTSEQSILRGAILAGGMSRRFGSDKALVEFDGVPLLHKLLKTLAEVVVDPVVVVNSLERYANLSCERLVDIVPGCGPLGGVHTVLHKFPADRVLILTCDMPLVTVNILQTLIQAWRPGDSAVVADFNSGLEPFPGIYNASLVGQIESCIQKRHLSLRQFLEGTPRVRKITGLSLKDVFLNMNTPEDFSSLQRQT